MHSLEILHFFEKLSGHLRHHACPFKLTTIIYSFPRSRDTTPSELHLQFSSLNTKKQMPYYYYPLRRNGALKQHLETEYYSR